MKKTIALSAISAIALSGVAYSQEESSISTDLTVSYNTEYIFRGLNFGDDLYTAGIDVAGEDFCGFDWSAGVWYGEFDTGSSNVTTTDSAGDTTQSSVANPDEEIDIYGEISKTYGGITASLGFIRFIFPDANNAGNTEVYAGVSGAYAGFDLGAKVFWNVDADTNSGTTAGDFYYEATASYSVEVTDQLGLSLGVAVGFFNNESDSGYAQTTVTLGASYALTDNISINPYIAYAGQDSDYADSFGADDDGDFFGGVSVGYSF